MLRNFYAKPIATIVIIAVIMILGTLQFFKLPIALYPNTSKPKVSARISTGTMNAKEFKDRYGDEIEAVLRAVRDVEKVEANYQNGYQRFDVEFKWGVIPDDAKADVKVAVDPFNSLFPEHWGNFRVSFEGEFNSQFFVSISSNSVSSAQLTEFAKVSIKPRVEAINGIGAAWVVDFENKTINITLRPTALTKFGLTFDDIRTVLKRREFDHSLGVLSIKDGESFQVNTSSRLTSVDDLRNVIVRENQGVPIKLRDVAHVEFKDEVPEDFFKANGKRTLLVGGFAQPDANIKQVADDFMSVIKAETAQISDDIKVETIMSPASFINEAIDNIISALNAGILITIICVFLFLGSLRDTLIICISIPLSLVGGFILMNLFNIELNLISLGAMALSVGMVVDGATVVLENILRHFDEQKPKNNSERIEVIIKAVSEVKTAVVASIMTTIIVFAPLPFTSPLTSAVLGDLAVVMVCVMVVSLFITLLFVPPLVVFFHSNKHYQQRTTGIYRLSSSFDNFFRRMQGLYVLSLEKILQRPRWSWVVTGLCAVLVGVGVWILSTQVRREVMARPDTDKLFLQIDIQDENLEFEQKEKLVNVYEQQIFSKFGKDVAHTLSHVGKWGSWVMVVIKDKEQIKEMKTKFEEYFKNTAYVRFYIGDWVPTSLEIPDPPLLKIVVLGQNDEDRRQLQEKISFKLQGHDAIGRREERPSIQKVNYLRVAIEEERLAKLINQETVDTRTNPLTEDWVGNALASYLNSEKIMEIEVNGVRQNVLMELPETFFKTQFDLENLLVKVGTKIVPIKAFAKIEHTEEWAGYYSLNSKLQNIIELWPKTGNWGEKAFEGDKDKLREELKQQILSDKSIDPKQLSFPDTMTEVNENIFSLVYALIFAILLIAVVIVLQFNSLTQTLINLVTIPLGFIGVAFSLWIFRSTLSLNSMLGLILLCGTAVNNSIIFIDFYNRLRTDEDKPMSAYDALIETGRLRLKPIMITVLTTVVGMLPIAFGYGSGGEILQPLGIAVCGGLWISTLLTIYFVPMIIYALSQTKNKFVFSGWLKRAKALTVWGLVLLFSQSAFTNKLSAETLELQQAINKAIANHPEIKMSESAVRRENYERKTSYSSLLPTVTLRREWLQSSTRFFESPIPGSPTGVITDKSAQNILTVEEKISNPYRFYNQHRILSLREDIAEYERDNKVNDIIAQVRIAYFKVLMAKVLSQNAEKSLVVAEENFKLSQSRFQGGFIHGSDVKRSELNFLQTRNTVAERNEQLQVAERHLASLLGDERKDVPKISASVPETFRYFARDEKFFENLTTDNDYNSLRPYELEVEAAKLSTYNSKLNFLPDLSASATFVRKDPRDEQSFYSEQAGPTYLVAAEWQVFSGGKSYFDYQSTAAKQQEIEQQLRLQRDTVRERLAEIVGNLRVLEKQHMAGSENVLLTEQILKSSRERFASGLLDSQQVNDDIKAYLLQQDNLIDLKQKIIESLAELAKLTGKNQLFDELL